MCKIPFVGKKADTKWNLSSAGRASALQAEGHRFEPYRFHFFAEVAQLARARGSYPRCREFESPPRYADVAQSVERRLGKAEVTSSILVISLKYPKPLT